MGVVCCWIHLWSGWLVDRNPKPMLVYQKKKKGTCCLKRFVKAQLFILMHVLVFSYTLVYVLNECMYSCLKKKGAAVQCWYYCAESFTHCNHYIWILVLNGTIRTPRGKNFCQVESIYQQKSRGKIWYIQNFKCIYQQKKVLLNWKHK